MNLTALWKCQTSGLHITGFPQFCIPNISCSQYNNINANSKVKMRKTNEIIAILKIPPTKSQPLLSGATPQVVLNPLLAIARNKHKGICGNK